MWNKTFIAAFWLMAHCSAAWADERKLSDTFADFSQEPAVERRAPVKRAPAKPSFQVESIGGYADNLQADITVNGQAMRVTQGASLPQGWSVSDIRPGLVVLRKGKDTERLQYTPPPLRDQKSAIAAPAIMPSGPVVVPAINPSMPGQ